jgi:predicted nuclease of predicted toxin-antitoxin system
MKLLFDQNLSHKLVDRLADVFPDSLHVRDIGMKSASDPAIVEQALRARRSSIEALASDPSQIIEIL